MHRTLSQGDENEDEEKAVIGFRSAFSWLVEMTLIISLLSEYVVATIEVHFFNYIFLEVHKFRIFNWLEVNELSILSCLTRLLQILGAFLLASLA